MPLPVQNLSDIYASQGMNNPQLTTDANGNSVYQASSNDTDVTDLYNNFNDKKDHSKTSNIDVDDLYKAFGEPVAKTEEKPQEFWQGFRNDPSWSGLLAKAGVSTLRGLKDIVDTGAEGLSSGVSAIADKVLPESLAGPIRQSAKDVSTDNKSSQAQYNSEYPPSEGLMPNVTDVGRAVGQIAGTAPLMPTKIFQGIRAAAGALPTVLSTGEKVAAPFVKRAIAATGVGAVGGGVLGAATNSTNDEGLASNVGKGIVTGGIGGPLVTGAGDLAKGIGSKVVGKVSSTVADLAKRAKELGIDLKATQVSGSPLLKKFDQMSGMLPFSGSQGITDKQIGQFTKAVSRTFGANTDEITPKVVSKARKDIGATMETVYKNSTVNADSKFGNDLQQIVQDMPGVLDDKEYAPIIHNIRNIITKINVNGEISGDAYHAMTKYDAVLSQAQQSRNPNIANFANRVRNALEGALDRSLPPDQKAILSKARSQYKAAMTVKDLVDQSAEGHVSPLKLMQKVIKSPGGKLRSGELGELADIGRKFFPTPADSGTPLGEKFLTGIGAALHNPISALSAGGGALLSGATYLDIGSAGIGLTANRVIRNILNSNVTRRAIIRSGTGETHGIINKLGEAVTPYSGKLVDDKRKMKLPIALQK